MFDDTRVEKYCKDSDKCIKFVLYVGNTTKADYDEYVNACADRGFTVDYRKGDDYYYANNENGYKLTLKFEVNNVMLVRIDKPDESDEPDEQAADPTATPKPTPSDSTDAQSPATTTPEVPEQAFEPQDVSDETIKSIKTYDDYLVMNQMIIDDYLTNYEAAIKGTVLWSEKTFADMKKTYEDACTFVPKIGQTAVIANKDIAKIALMLAPTVGTGELSVIAVTGFTQKVTFLSPQNPAVHDAVSYLLHVAPNALFVNLSSQETQSSAPVSKGAACPKCKSANTQTMGESKVFTVWKIIVGVFLIVAGFGSMSPGFSPSWVLIIGGAALAANGTPFLSKKKVDCVCMDCRKRFRF